MKKITKKIYYYTQQFCQSIIGIICIVLFSKKSGLQSTAVKKQITDKEKILILGNGPSLKASYERNKEYFCNSNLFVVNNFCESPLFAELKPKYYIVIDPAYFREISDDFDILTRDNFVKNLNKIDWNIFLFVPHEFKYCHTQQLIKNSNIHFVYINLTPFNGLKSIRHFIYRMELGMPTPQNVLHAAIFIAIRLKFKNIELYGADHSWTIDVRVNHNNETCMRDSHFYDDENALRVLPGFNMTKFTNALSVVFSSHILLSEFAKASNINILNCTKNSFIDAYNRL